MSNVFQDQEQDQEEVESQEENASTNESVFGTKPDKPETPVEQMARIKQEVMERLYKHDPHIREMSDAFSAIEASRGQATHKESPFEYDSGGNLIGVKPSHKGKVSPYELMKEIRKNAERRLGGGA